MVEHGMLSSVFKSLARWCLGPVLLALCGLPGALAQDAQANGGVSLKLDWDLVPRAGTPGISRAELLDAEGPELRSRILKVQDQVAALEQSNATKSYYLDNHEELIERMRGVVKAQEKVIARLTAEARQRPKPVAQKPEFVAQQPEPVAQQPESVVQKPESVVQKPESVAMVQAPVTAPRPAPSPEPHAPTTKAPIHFGPLELPGTVTSYLTEGAFAALVVIVLAWALYLRSVARARNAELIMLKGGETATPTSIQEDDPEELENIPKLEPLPVAEFDPSEATAEEFEAAERAASSPEPSGSETGPELEWSETVVREKAADPEALAEVDTLIAEGELHKARQLLAELTKGNEADPEYTMRLLHVNSQLGDSAKASEEEQILASMKDGPLSGTLDKIKEIGRGLMPGHPLFEDDEKLEEAKRIITSQESTAPGSPVENAPEEIEPRKPVAASAQPRQAPPLILDLEVDDETIDYVGDISLDAEDEADETG